MYVSFIPPPEVILSASCNSIDSLLEDRLYWFVIFHSRIKTSGSCSRLLLNSSIKYKIGLFLKDYSCWIQYSLLKTFAWLSPVFCTDLSTTGESLEFCFIVTLKFSHELNIFCSGIKNSPACCSHPIIIHQLQIL